MPDGKEFNPKASIYVDDKSASKVALAGKLGVLLTFVTIAALVIVVVNRPAAWSQTVVLGLAATWGIGGPMWFFYEYFFIYREGGAPDSWELFKHGQQVSAAVWVALTGSLTVVGASDFVKVKEATYRCELNSSATAPASATSALVLSCAPAK
ncbi:hypothetical protein [Piscinibacter sp.]|uniref:hypothetical protein n=1 Tax=Piscinibacter sp. TaxID=1903157 RepID=UPI0039E45AA9